MMARVTVFHTSDLHNKLNHCLAERLRLIRSGSPGSIVLDSGDAISAGNVFWRFHEPILDLMNSVPYDAMCPGNREFHFLARGLFAKTANAEFPIVSANLRPAKFGFELPVRSSVVIETPEARVGVLGLSVPCITERMLVKRISDAYFDDPCDAAARFVPDLREKCDILIALTHIGIKQDRELAERVPGIDVILGGHTHTVTNEPERVGETYILHHGAFAHHVGKVIIEKSGGRVTVTDELIPLAKA